MKVSTFLGGLIVVAGAVVLFFSAKMSMTGYERAFPAMAGAGFIGLGISTCAFATSGAIAVTWSRGQYGVAILAFLLSIVGTCGDAFGNFQSLEGHTLERLTASQRQTDEYEQALAKQLAFQDERASLRLELSIATGEDIKAAQRLLKGKGLYSGKIDGVLGTKTDAALFDFGQELRASIAETETEEARLEPILKSGRGEVLSENATTRDLIIAIVLSLVSMACAGVGFPTMASSESEEDLDQMERDLEEINGFVNQLLGE